MYFFRQIWNWIISDPTKNLAQNPSEMSRHQNSWKKTWFVVLAVTLAVILFAGCEAVGGVAAEATGNECIKVKNYTAEKYVVWSETGAGSRNEIEFGGDAKHWVYSGGDNWVNVDLSIAIVEDGSVLTTENDEVRFDADKVGCELVEVSLDDLGGFEIDH